MINLLDKINFTFRAIIEAVLSGVREEKSLYTCKDSSVLNNAVTQLKRPPNINQVKLVLDSGIPVIISIQKKKIDAKNIAP